MNLLQLRCFVAAFEEGSFSAAAERLNATQSGLSTRIRDLEVRHSVTLFDRSSAGVVPTERGKLLYKHAVKVLRSVAEAEANLHQTREQVSGHVKAGLMPTFTRSVLPAALMRLKKEYPFVTVTVEEAYSAALSTKTEHLDLDFSIVPAALENPALQSTPIGVDREYLVCAAGRTRGNRTPVKITDFSPLKLVLPSPENARRARIDAYLADLGAKVDQRLELDAMLATLELVAQSDWMAILPGILCMADKDSTRRWVHPIDGPHFTVSYYLIEPSSRVLSPAATAFASILREELELCLHWDTTLEYHKT